MGRKTKKIRWGRVLFVCAALFVCAYALSRTAGMQWGIDPQVDRALRQSRNTIREKLPDIPLPTINEAAPQAGEIRAYFAPDSENAKDGMDDRFVAFLNSAEESIDAAFYELDFEPAAQALIRQHARGLRVRLATDSDYKDEAPLQECLAAGIEVVLDKRSGFMHNKFCVVDGDEVWTGSTNITRNCFFKNNNNALHIISKDLAENFGVEFEEMFNRQLFGKKGATPTPHPALKIANTPVACYFSPDDGVEGAILAKINAAQKSIGFAAFSFTSEPIAGAMAERMKDGVKVRGVFEARNAGSRYSRDDYLAERGAKIYMDKNPNNMHHKFIVIDAQTLITGSYNFSKSAEKENDENCLIIEDPALAGLYQNELEKMIAPH